MLNKLRLGTSALALLLFLFPWVDMQCSGRTLITQSGLQTVYGGASISEELESMGGQKEIDKEEDKEGAGIAFFTAIALLATIGAVILFAKEVTNPAALGKTGTILATAAFVALLLQMLIGFPLERSIAESMEADSSEDAQMAAAMGMAIQVKYRATIFFVLALLAVPGLIAANALLDKKRAQATEG